MCNNFRIIVLRLMLFAIPGLGAVLGGCGTREASSPTSTPTTSRDFKPTGSLNDPLSSAQFEEIARNLVSLVSTSQSPFHFTDKHAAQAAQTIPELLATGEFTVPPTEENAVAALAAWNGVQLVNVSLIRERIAAPKLHAIRTKRSTHMDVEFRLSDDARGLILVINRKNYDVIAGVLNALLKTIELHEEPDGTLTFFDHTSAHRGTEYAQLLQMFTGTLLNLITEQVPAECHLKYFRLQGVIVIFMNYFQIAHEYAHFFRKDSGRTSWGREFEADRIAARLLHRFLLAIHSFDAQTLEEMRKAGADLSDADLGLGIVAPVLFLRCVTIFQEAKSMQEAPFLPTPGLFDESSFWAHIAGTTNGWSRHLSIAGHPPPQYRCYLLRRQTEALLGRLAADTTNGWKVAQYVTLGLRLDDNLSRLWVAAKAHLVQSLRRDASHPKH